MNKSTNIHQLEASILYSLTSKETKKRPALDGVGTEYFLAVRKRHNHKYYYSTFQNKSQYIFGNLLFFYFMNKIILSTLYIMDIAISKEMCYTVITTEEVHANGKVNRRL